MKRNRLLFYSLCLFGFVGNLWAAIYIPTPLVDQVKDSYGVIRGTFQGKVYKKNNRDQVITEVSIAVNESAGLKPGDIINKNNFKSNFSWRSLAGN